MIAENFLSISMTVFVFVTGFMIFRITSKINKSIDSSISSKLGRSTLGAKYLRNSNNLERLLREQDPFNWRIGLALSVADLDPKSEQQFLKSLTKVLRLENSVIREKHEQKRRYLRQLIHPILPSKKFNEIVKFRDMFTVKRLMDGATDRETLKYILQLSIDEYEAKKIPPQSFTRTITYLEADEDPFGPEAPF